MPISTFISIITIYALFGDDIRLALCSKGADPYFYSVTCVVMVIFFAEIILQSIAIEGYFMNLYFWLDLISTLSLITDIGWIWNRVVNQQDFVNIDG